jgi:hypothetical protein
MEKEVEWKDGSFALLGTGARPQGGLSSTEGEQPPFVLPALEESLSQPLLSPGLATVEKTKK